MTRFGTRSLLRLGHRTLSWIVRLLATLLLFVGPAHATARQISAEHLPTVFGEMIDAARTNKLALRTHTSTAIYLACAGAGDEGLDLLPVSGECALSPVFFTSASGCFARFQGLMPVPYGLAFGRAPPLA